MEVQTRDIIDRITCKATTQTAEARDISYIISTHLIYIANFFFNYQTYIILFFLRGVSADPTDPTVASPLNLASIFHIWNWVWRNLTTLFLARKALVRTSTDIGGFEPNTALATVTIPGFWLLKAAIAAAGVLPTWSWKWMRPPKKTKTSPGLGTSLKSWFGAFALLEVHETNEEAALTQDEHLHGPEGECGVG